MYKIDRPSTKEKVIHTIIFIMFGVFLTLGGILIKLPAEAMIILVVLGVIPFSLANIFMVWDLMPEAFK